MRVFKAMQSIVLQVSRTQIEILPAQALPYTSLSLDELAGLSINTDACCLLLQPDCSTEALRIPFATQRELLDAYTCIRHMWENRP